MLLPSIPERSVPLSELVSVNEYIDERQCETLFENKQKARNIAIAYYYQYALDAPTEEHWDGRDGVVLHVCEHFHILTEMRCIGRRVLKEVQICKRGSIVYRGYADRDWGRKSIILYRSKGERIIADWMEQGLGFR